MTFTNPDMPEMATEDRFVVEARRMDLLYSHDLLGHGMGHLMNGLANLLEEETVSPEDKEVFRGCLCRLITANPYSLYRHLLDSCGPDGISTPLWVSLAFYLPWPWWVSVFRDMSTEALQNNAELIWKYIRQHRMADHRTIQYHSQIYLALLNRRDIYGPESLPTEFAFALLLNEEYAGWPGGLPT